MNESTLLVSSVLLTKMPRLPEGVTITDAEHDQASGTVRLWIKGDAVPDGGECVAEYTQPRGQTEPSFVRFVER